MPLDNSDSSMLTCYASERSETPATPPWKRFENVFELSQKSADRSTFNEKLKLNEQISLMSRLAAIIEKQTCVPDTPVIKTKKIKRIPDAVYNQYLNNEGLQKLRESSLASIREILKNDEW